MTIDPKNFNEGSGLSSDDKMISEMLGGLKRVNAPADFDMRVRARIAAGRPGPVHAFGLSPVLRYAGGLLVLVAAATGVSFYMTLPQAGQPVPTASAVLPPVEEQPVAVPQSDSTATANERQIAEVITAPSTGPAMPMDIQSRPRSAGPVITKGPIAERDLGGSYDEATKRGKTLYPLGLDPNSARVPIPVNPGANSINTMIAAVDVLSFLGVNVRSGAGSLTVESVRPNSAASKAGLVAGDVIESINGQPVVADMQFNGTFVGRSMVVRRNGTSIPINLAQK